MKNTTLIYLEQDHRYLMMLRNRKENDPNAGKWIGVGGRIEEGETPDECAVREIYEETGFRVNSLRFRGLVIFINTEYETEYMFLYTTDDFDPGVPHDTACVSSEPDCDEGELHWIDIDEVDSLNLWDGDRIFLKLLKEDSAPFILTLRYDGDDLFDSSCSFIDPV